MTDDLKLAFLAKTGDSDTQALVAEVYALRAELHSERKDYADLAKARDALVLVIAERDELREQLRRYAPSAGQRIRDLDAELAESNLLNVQQDKAIKKLKAEVERMRPVVEAVNRGTARKYGIGNDECHRIMGTYRAASSEPEAPNPHCPNMGRAYLAAVGRADYSAALVAQCDGCPECEPEDNND